MQDVVDELDGGLLVELRVDTQDSQAGAVVDRGELVVLVASASPTGGASEGLDELDVDLYVVTGALLLVAFPPPVVPLVALRARDPADVQPFQDAPYAGLADVDIVVTLEVHGDLLGPEVVVLPQVQDPPHDLHMGGIRADLRTLGTGAQAIDALSEVAAEPDVAGLPADPVVAAVIATLPVTSSTWRIIARRRFASRSRPGVGSDIDDLRSVRRPERQTMIVSFRPTSFERGDLAGEPKIGCNR